MKQYILSIFFILSTLLTYSSTNREHITIAWKIQMDGQTPDVAPSMRLHFEQAVYDGNSDGIPMFQHKIKLPGKVSSAEAEISNAVFETLSNDELILIDNLIAIPLKITTSTHISRARGQSIGIVSFLPFRLNVVSGKYEKLVSFDLILRSTENLKSETSGANFAEKSVLATGNWYKVKVQETGIYKVTYEQMAEMGISVSGLKSANIRLYGNGGGMLPEDNSKYRPDDLLENAIAISDGGDNVFNSGDYFLFYGTSPDQWKFNSESGTFDFLKNVYDDYSYYYITVDHGQGKRISNLPSTTEAANITATTFTDFDAYETDDYNLTGSGRMWFGDVYDLKTSYDYNFSFPNINTSAEHFLRVRVVAKATLSSTFNTSINGTNVLTVPIPGTPFNTEGEFAKIGDKEARISLSDAEINLNLRYNKSSSNAIAWLDCIQMNVIRNLTFSGSQMNFRNIASIGSENITQFNLGNAASGVSVWEVTNLSDIKKIQGTVSGNKFVFRLATDNLREFVAFDGSGFLSAESDGKVPNQNLHGKTNIEYVIISHPDFLDQANRLADFHRSFSGLNTLVTTPMEVYNEFSSGAQDITAIKDLMRMFYERGKEGTPMLKYLLLFGDASYDYKNRIEFNTNFVPTFESVQSLHYIYSYATDDYFGFLDPDEGVENKDLLDIGIGRFVVSTPKEASNAVDKVIHYATSPQNMGNWRNVVTFVADDEDSNSHMSQANQLATFVDTTYPNYNVDKIYIDAYKQETTAGGQRYPEVNEAINSSIEKGTLIINYTGHGGEVGWALERILEVQDIQNWTNVDKLSVFVTATCEFARYDDPKRVSAGEYVFLNPNGGAIALFTTARATFSGSNLSLNRGFYKYAFEAVDGEHHTMGDLIRLAKMESTSASNDKKFVLLGDPALKMSYPNYHVLTTGIYNSNDGTDTDTLRALSQITIEGIINDDDGTLLTTYNGQLHSIVYDKESDVTTLGQDPSSSPYSFRLRKNIIYKGKTMVVDGKFSFSFIVPKDISYNFGTGKISYYAQNDSFDASGHNLEITIGGFDNNNLVDTEGPIIELYMNDTTFKDGDFTNQNPVLYARIYDESGINTVGNSIGHDITAILNDVTDKPYILNDFYESSIKGFQSGELNYPFSNLDPGEHEVKLRVWDVFNNSSEATLKFVVVNKEQILISNAYNRPNPFSTDTWFEYNHNQANETVDVRIEIFDLNGRLVTTLQQNNTSSGFYPSPIRWDGTSSAGNRLPGGIYVYRIQLQDVNGQSSYATKKIVIAR